MRLKSHYFFQKNTNIEVSNIGINTSHLPESIENIALSVDWNDLRLVTKLIRKIVVRNYSIQNIVNYRNGNQSDRPIAALYNSSASELAKLYLSASVEDLSKLDFKSLDYKAIRALN